MKKNRVLDSFISVGSFKDFIEGIFSLSEEKQSSYVCVCNVHMLVEAQKDKDFNKLLNNADIVSPDGMPIAKLLSYKYQIKQDRVSGMDLLPILIAESANKNKSVYLYGSTDDVLSRIANKAQTEFPHLNIQYYAPPFIELSLKEDKNIVKEINSFKPDFVFVALGCPKQEKWIAANQGIINSCMIGLGGAFEVYAGLRKRAPKWMYQNSLEWLYRLLLEPKRLSNRYLRTNTLFLYYVCKEFLKIGKK
jgi:N-acetylglucosaminyldiphosphoundecaprenol N-acetyl-beta-D-mannosaminyltransferase